MGWVLGVVHAVGDRVGAIDGRLALAALVLHVANHVLRSVAWRNVLAAAYPRTRIRLLEVAAAYAAGVGLNAILPGRGGDAVKVALIRARVPGSSVPTIAATLSVVVLFDLVAATALVLVLFASGAAPPAVRPPSPTAAAAWATGHAVVIVGTAAMAAAAVVVAVWRFRRSVRRVLARLRQGGAILRTPRRYVARVAAVQAAAWACRVGVVVCLLAAFGLPASVGLAALVMILGGASTLVPLTPGGAGTQQAMIVAALHGTATVAASLSFSVGMQGGITAVNGVLGMIAAMVVFRTLRPAAAIRAGLRLARSETPAV